jgi:transcriptional regulator with XRE-family HTH domain
MHAICYNIRQIRIIKNFTQEYEADQLGVSTEWYGKIESGKAKLDVNNLEKIAKILDVDPAYFHNFNTSHFFDQCDQKGAYIANNQHISNDMVLFQKMVEILDKISKRLDK